MNRFLRESAVLFAAAIVLAVLSNVFASQERRLAWFSRAPVSPRVLPGPAAAGASVDFHSHPDHPWFEITPEQAKSLFDRGTIFFDARRSAACREGHIRGARSISVWEADADEKVKKFFDEGHDPNAPIVVYCSGGDCEDSHELAQKLWGVTFDNVYVYKDGFPDWQKRGWPVETGTPK